MHFFVLLALALKGRRRGLGCHSSEICLSGVPISIRKVLWDYLWKKKRRIKSFVGIQMDNEKLLLPLNILVDNILMIAKQILHQHHPALTFII